MNFFFCSLLCTILFYSCTNEKNGIIEEEIDYLKVSRVLEIADVDLQKKEYGTLKSEEKNAIWQSRINTFVDNNELSLVQKQVLTELQANLNALLFEKSSLNEAKKLEAEWLPKALMVFNPKAIKLLVGGLQDEILQPKIIEGKT